MTYPSICYAGRFLFRDDGVGGLDWVNPCPVPAENVMKYVPPIYLCTAHFMVVADVLYEQLDAAGMIDHDIVAGPGDEFDELIEALGLDDPERAP